MTYRHYKIANLLILRATESISDRLLVRLNAPMVGEVKDLSMPTQLVIACNCAAARRGGEQQGVNGQFVG